MLTNGGYIMPTCTHRQAGGIYEPAIKKGLIRPFFSYGGEAGI